MIEEFLKVSIPMWNLIFIFISFIIIIALVNISILFITMFITTLRAIYSVIKRRFNKK
jgi:hypothetical protein